MNINVSALLSVAVIALSVWLLVEALDHVSKTGDVIFAVVSGVLGVVAFAASIRRS